MSIFYEKAAHYGLGSLTDKEVLSSLVGNTHTAEKILNYAGNSLHKMACLGLADFNQFLDNEKAMVLVAAFEIYRRKQIQAGTMKKKVSCSRDASNILTPLLSDLENEHLYVIFTNTANEVLWVENMSSGAINSTLVDPRMILKRALALSSTALILAHNHPSGKLQPSQSDIDITKKIAEGCKLLDMQLLDHLIITHRGYYSFADEGQIPNHSRLSNYCN